MLARKGNPEVEEVPEETPERIEPPE